MKRQQDRVSNPALVHANKVAACGEALCLWVCPIQIIDLKTESKEEPNQVKNPNFLETNSPPGPKQAKWSLNIKSG